MKITDYNLNLHSNSTTTELKQSASKTELSTSETSSQGHFASEQGAVFSASATTQSKLKISSEQVVFKNIIKFADEAIKSLKNLRDSLGLGGGESDKLSNILDNMKRTLNGEKIEFSTKQGYTKDGIYAEVLTTTTLESSTQKNSALSVAAQGIIKTPDKEINLNLNFNLSQSFVRQNLSISKQLVSFRLVDPLVINLSGELPSLDERTFSFDIDSDGELDQISRLKSGSGFLALDKNGNGAIDDGSELFGTKTGDGFGELASYDEDGNGWIDENDSIFAGLRVWLNDSEGSRLIALGEAGVGAIFLGSTQSGFELKNSDDQTLGVLQKSGVFLFESGEAGAISHIDIAKQTPVYAQFFCCVSASQNSKIRSLWGSKAEGAISFKIPSKIPYYVMEFQNSLSGNSR